MSDPNNSSSAEVEPADTTIAPGDVLSRLQAAGIEEDDAYEDIDELGNNGEPAEDADPLKELLPDDDKPDGEEEQLELDEEGKPKQAPDALGLQGKGTREAPLRHRDLPADKFVEVKNAAGERVVVNLKDALSGTFMSKDKVDREVNLAKDAQTRAEALGTRALAHMKEANRSFQAMLGDSEKLVKALVEHRMPVLRDLAHAYYMMTRKDPGLRGRLLAEMREERVAAESQAVERRRQQLEQQEQESAQRAQLERDLEPAYRQGLREAGILRKADVTPELSKAIRIRYHSILSQEGRPPTPEEMKWCVTDAAADLKARGKLGKPPARPRAAPTPPANERTTPRPANGKVDWTKVPHEQRMRDPRFLFDKAARRAVQ